MMLPYKGCYYNIQQYLKGKPVKFGIKMWALASSQSRYVNNVIVYLGVSDVCEEDAVLVAICGMEGRRHVMIMDNFFTSVKFFMTLLERGFYATATLKKDSKGFPPSLAGFPATHQPAQRTLVVKMHQNKKILAIVWIDSCPVWLLSIALDPVPYKRGTEVDLMGATRISHISNPVVVRAKHAQDQCRGLVPRLLHRNSPIAQVVAQNPHVYLGLIFVQLLYHVEGKWGQFGPATAY